MSDQTSMFDLPDAPAPIATPAAFELPDEGGALAAPPLPRSLEPTIVSATELMPIDAIVSQLKALVAPRRHEGELLVRQAHAITTIADDETEIRTGHVVEELAANVEGIGADLKPYTETAFTLHRACTGVRSEATGSQEAERKRLADLLARRLRAKQEAEAERQRQEREKAVAAERDRLEGEAKAAEAETARLAQEAAAARSQDEARVLAQQAEQSRREAEQARVEAATVTAPPVAARPVSSPGVGSVRDNWQALPAHAEAWEDFPVEDKCALILHVAERLHAGDRSLVNLLEVSKQACKDLAKAQKSLMKVPGLRPVNPPTFTRSRRA